MNQSLFTATIGQGIPVVFIHGWGLNSAVWDPTVQQLKNTLEVTTIDLPGFGSNINHTLTSYTLTNVVNAIQACIKKPSVIVGWSLGGLVATELALKYPNKVNGLITIASSPCFIAKEQTEVSDDGWPGIQPTVLKSFHQQLAQNTKKTIEGFLKIQAMGSPHVRQDIKTIRDLVMQFDLPTVNTLDASLSLLETVDLRKQLPSIAAPCLRMYGSLDSLVPKNAIKQISALMPSSQTHVFEKASHAPFISHPEAFNRELIDWLNEYVA